MHQKTHLLLLRKLLINDITLSENTERLEGLSKIELKWLFLSLNVKPHDQVDGVAMCSPLGPALANVFLVYFEKNWLRNCLSDFKHYYYRWYVNNIFVLLNSLGY